MTVITPAGTSATSPADQSTSAAAAVPTVSGISPTSGSSAGGTVVTITGTNFTDATLADFGTTAVGITAVSDTSITATSPAGTGTVDVTVTSTSGTSATSPADQFTYTAAVAPTVTAVSPPTGSTVGSTSVTITGTSFTGATAVDFGTTPATDVTVFNDTTITANSPAGTGTVNVTVTAPGGTSADSPADQFTYTAAAVPTVTGISPTGGPASGGSSVMITGTSFIGATAVDFGTTPATEVFVFNDTTITADIPAGTGTVNVTVTAPGGTSADSPADLFTYAAAAPTRSQRLRSAFTPGCSAVYSDDDRESDSHALRVHGTVPPDVRSWITARHCRSSACPAGHRRLYGFTIAAVTGVSPALPGFHRRRTTWCGNHDRPPRGSPPVSDTAVTTSASTAATGHALG